MKIKEYQVEHQSKLLSIVKQFSESDKKNWFKGKWTDINYYKQHFLQEPQYKTFFAEENKNIIGFLVAEKKSPELLWLEIFYVSQNYRGKNVGNELVNKLELYARQNKYKKLECKIAHGNEPSINAIKSHNWEIKIRTYIQNEKDKFHIFEKYL